MTALHAIRIHSDGGPQVLRVEDPWRPEREVSAAHLVRISEAGEIEQAGGSLEVWVDFAWQGPFEGDFFRPFNTIAAGTR